MMPTTIRLAHHCGFGTLMILTPLATSAMGCGSGDDCDDPFTDAVETCGSSGEDPGSEEGPGGEEGPGATTTSSCTTPALTLDYITNCGSATWYVYDGSADCLVGGTWRFSPGGNLSVENNCAGDVRELSYTFGKIDGNRLYLESDGNGLLWFELLNPDLRASFLQGQWFLSQTPGGVNDGGADTGCSGEGSLGFTSVGSACGAGPFPQCVDYEGGTATVACDTATCTWTFLDYCPSCPSGSSQICTQGTCGCSAQSQ